MYGQTNCWVLPSGQYGAFAVHSPPFSRPSLLIAQINQKEIFICTPRAARNLAFQGFSPKNGIVEGLAECTGQDLIGARVKVSTSSSCNP